MLFTRHLLTAEECSEVAGTGRWEWEDRAGLPLDMEMMWKDRLAQVLSTKPAEVVQEAHQVLEKHGYPDKDPLSGLS